MYIFSLTRSNTRQQPTKNKNYLPRKTNIIENEKQKTNNNNKSERRRFLLLLPISSWSSQSFVIHPLFFSRARWQTLEQELTTLLFHMKTNGARCKQPRQKARQRLNQIKPIIIIINYRTADRLFDIFRDLQGRSKADFRFL